MPVSKKRKVPAQPGLLDMDRMAVGHTPSGESVFLEFKNKRGRVTGQFSMATAEVGSFIDDLMHNYQCAIGHQREGIESPTGDDRMADAKGIAITTAANLLSAYMHLRAQSEGLASELDVKFFYDGLSHGCRNFFGVEVDPEAGSVSGVLVKDTQNPAFFAKWQSGGAVH